MAYLPKEKLVVESQLYSAKNPRTDIDTDGHAVPGSAVPRTPATRQILSAASIALRSTTRPSCVWRVGLRPRPRCWATSRSLKRTGMPGGAHRFHKRLSFGARLPSSLITKFSMGFAFLFEAALIALFAQPPTATTLPTDRLLSEPGPTFRIDDGQLRTPLTLIAYGVSGGSPIRPTPNKPTRRIRRLAGGPNRTGASRRGNHEWRRAPVRRCHKRLCSISG